MLSATAFFAMLRECEALILNQKRMFSDNHNSQNDLPVLIQMDAANSPVVGVWKALQCRLLHYP